MKNKATSTSASLSAFPLRIFYDASCPVCRLEMHELRERDLRLHADSPRLQLVDMSAPGFDAAKFGASLAEMNALIHAQRPDGSLVIGVEVFRMAYGAVGLGAWWSATRWPLLRPVVDAAYKWFAHNRYGISRALSPLVLWIERRRIERRAQSALRNAETCRNGLCDLDPSHFNERTSS